MDNSQIDSVREGILLGLGNPLLDISANVDNKLLRKYDMNPDDAILAEEKHLPLYEELIKEYNADFIAGGSVQNSFRVCQWILQKPNTTVFFGCVGDDKYARILEKKAREDGVNVVYEYTKEDPTGTCAVLITNTHRSLCANLAAANHFTIDHLHNLKSRHFISEANFFYISGFFLTVNPRAIMEIAEYACSKNHTFMMNLSAPFIPQHFNEPLMDVIPYIDILFGNEAEAKSFSQAQGWNVTDVRDIGGKILNLPKKNKNRKRIVIMTQGQHPVLLIQHDSIIEYLVNPIKSEEIVDTNGAGDAFVGGFLAQFIQGKSLDVCINCGIWAAQKIIRSSGCTFFGKPDFCNNIIS